MKLRTTVLLVAILAMLATMPQVTKDTSEARISEIGPCFTLLNTYLMAYAEMEIAFHNTRQQRYEYWLWMGEDDDTAWDWATEDATFMTQEYSLLAAIAFVNYERQCGAITQ